jgi:hypothetical protein
MWWWRGLAGNREGIGEVVERVCQGLFRDTRRMIQLASQGLFRGTNLNVVPDRTSGAAVNTSGHAGHADCIGGTRVGTERSKPKLNRPLDVAGAEGLRAGSGVASPWHHPPTTTRATPHGLSGR